MTVSIGVVSNLVQIGMKTLDGCEEVCVLRYHRGVGKKEEVSRVFPNSMEKRMSVGEQERVKRKRRTDENKRINWWLEMIISGQCLKMRARKMAYWV